MTLYDFNILELNYKMEVVNQQGIYLDNYVTKVEKFNLYAVDRFFVEVCYSSKQNKIVEIKSFISGHLLDRYSNFSVKDF